MGGLAVTIDTRGNMNLFITNPNTRFEAGRDNDDPHYLAHQAEPSDFYQKYKNSDHLPIKGERHLQNLFDDSDVKDYYWFNIARKFIGRVK